MLDHLDDLASDFSAVHGITDMMTLPGPVFLRLAWRIGSYQGVIRDLITARAAAQHQDGQSALPAAEPDRVASRLELQSDPVFSQIFSFGAAG